MAGLGKTKIVVVCGPTASGKTEMALHIARHMNGELVGADSMQVYTGLPVGTAALPVEQAGGVPQHLVGFLSPAERYSVADYCRDAAAVIQEIAGRGALPVLCGGTGLYVDSLVNGICFTEESFSEEERRAYEEQWAAQGGDAMLARLAALDPDCAAKLHVGDKKRILRALMLSERDGTTLRGRNEASRAAQSPYEALYMAPDFPKRQELYDRIDSRVDTMLERGLLREAWTVYDNRERYATASQAIGYKEFFPYFEETATLAACTDRLKQATRNYAKRQLTWFRRLPDIHWLRAGTPEMGEQACALVRSFLGQDEGRERP